MGNIMQEQRPPVSGSMALHCRREIYLAAHGAVPEPTLPSAARTFDLGHIVEAAMLRGVEAHDGQKTAKLGPWWPNLGEVKDYASGRSFIASSLSQLRQFQREVSFAGFKGHIDCLVDLPEGVFVLDVKTTQGFGYDRHKTSVLLEDPFAREYVGQLHFYMAGLKAEGVKIAGGILLFYNKEQSNVMCRFVDYDPAIVAECEERLSWADLKQTMHPKADWDWYIDEKLPLRCSYCNLREACAKSRGVSLKLNINTKGKPEWFATA